MQFIQCKTIRDALKARAETGYPVLAGGTDLIVQWKSGIPKPAGVISVWGINKLAAIAETDDTVEIGTLATHAKIAKSELIQKYIPALACACRTIGAVQIQNRGTIGGNVMNGSPAGDTLPVLLAYETDVELQSVRRKRTVPFGKFYTGYRATVVAKDEIVAKFIIRKPQASERVEFMKVGTRQAQAISKICACFRSISEGCYSQFVIAYGSVAPTPIRCPKTEKFLSGRKIGEAAIADAVRLVQEEVSPIDDIRSTGDYRRDICGVLLKRFLSK